MLKQFIAFLDAEEWELDSMQIAEILWFVQQVSPLVPETDESVQRPETPESEDLRGEIPESEDLIEGSGKQEDKSENNKKAEEQSFPVSLPQNSSTIPQSSQSASPTPIEQTSLPTEKLPIKLPDTGIFCNTLELGRLTKPLKQKINSRIAQELNVKETVRRSAELSTPKFRCYFPVLTPKKERWLDVALLIEDSESMILWQSLLKEVQDFLEHLGAFRDIKPYRMNWDDDKKNLQISSFHSLSNYLSPQRLNDPGGRRLILIVSDCISSAWTSDKFIEILKEWSTKGLLTLLNPFPERMWERTNLDYSIKIRLGNEKKGLPSQKWSAIPLESWQVKGVDEQTKQTLVKLPILSLEPESMGAWVNVMMGKGTSLCSGVWLGSNFMYPEDEEEDDDDENLTPLQQINNFYATSSQLAWELIQWLSAIPVSLSTIRLVQRTLLPKSTQVNVAEVVMGGLLSPVKPLNSYQSPHQIQFEFKPGIRQAFLNRLGEGEFCLGVIGSLTEKIASHFGYQTVREFEAILLTNPLELRGDDDLELIQAFATISVSTLRQYGREYAPYIRKLDRSRARLNLISAVEGDSVSQNWIDFLEGIAKQHNLTDIESETIINLFPTPQQSCSIRDLAKQLLSSPSAISSRLTNIYRKFETLTPDLFPSKKHNKLKTLQLYLYAQYVKSTSPEIPELETFESFEFEAEVATIVFEEETNQEQEKLQQWAFKTPTVNRRGETIKTTTHTASYFTETLTDNVDLEMVAIPGGTFTMGSPENEGYDDERPQHQVTVSPFFMGKYPVTQAQWQVIASQTDLKVEIDLNPDPSSFKGDTRPVETVNWYEAVEFCQRLSKLTGRDYRLPSEAEWEYACRGVTEPLDLDKGESYPPFYFGETITAELANYNASSTYADEPKGEESKETTPVGQFPPNAFGLYDMHGQVWEWCADDWHDNYENAPTDGSAWIDSNEEENINNENESYSSKNNDNESYPVLRGGSLLLQPEFCRSATRFILLRRDIRDDYFGFRVVCGFGRTL